MTKSIIPILLFLLTQVCLTGQTDTVEIEDLALKYAKEIDAADLQRYLMILSSDEYAGRETATPGALKASQYIAAQFENFRLSEYREGKGFFQTVPFQRNSWKNINLKLNDTTYKHMVDYVALLPLNYNRSNAIFREVMFCGYGIGDKRYNDFNLAEVKGKAIMIYKGEPKDKNGNYFISGTEQPSPWSTNIELKLKAARGAGAALVMIIEDEVKDIVAENRQFLIDGKIRLHDGQIRQKNDIVNSVYISPAMAKSIMGEKYDEVISARDKILDKGKTKGKAIALPAKIEIQQEKYADVIKGNNVLGYLEGSDPDLKDEIVVISAHYDHLGTRGEKIFNGANDNASGTSTVIEVMQAFAKAKAKGHGPKRSILALLVCGEEKGLLGSKYFITQSPFKLENIIANVNIDMVGRTDELHKEDEEYIYVIGADKLSSELHDINETANKTYTNLELDYTYNDDNDPNRYYYRSDHYNFAKEGIPVIFYFNGVHSDYHKSSDTIDKINFDLMEKTVKLVFHTTWELANRPTRIKKDKVN